MRKSKLSDRGLTARQLISNVPAYIRYNGEYVTALQATRKQRKGVTVYDCKTRTNVLGEKPRLHKQTITVLGGAERASAAGTRLKVSCDCEFFTYTCEVALFRYGAADIIYSNGEFPYQTNPRGIPLVCKHLHVLLEKIIRTKS